MFLDGHLDIQTYELAHVSVSERIFSSEDWADFEDSLEVAHNTHLLIQLWGLGQTCLFAEISQTENIGSTFWWTTNQLWSMDFDEVKVQKELSKELTDTWLESEDSVLSGCSKIDDSVIKSGFHLDDCLFGFFFNLLLLFLLFFLLLLLLFGLSFLCLSLLWLFLFSCFLLSCFLFNFDGLLWLFVFFIVKFVW